MGESCLPVCVPRQDDVTNVKACQDATTPLLPDETFPRQCDEFTTTGDPNAKGSFESALFSLSLRDQIYFHGRGGYLSGRLRITVGALLRAEFSEEQVLVKVDAKFERPLYEWHVCRTGADGVEGIVLLVSHCMRWTWLPTLIAAGHDRHKNGHPEHGPRMNLALTYTSTTHPRHLQR